MSEMTDVGEALPQYPAPEGERPADGAIGLAEQEAPHKEIVGEGSVSPSQPPLPSGPVLVIAAHPDDPDFGCGGTIARLVDAGRHVVVAVVTDGTEGGEDPTVPDDELRDRREGEQRAALQELGVQEVAFLRFPDGRLEANLALRRALTALIRRHKPRTVFTHDPTAHISAGYINHPDHRACGLATLDAIFPSVGNPRAFRDLLDEGLPPHKVGAVYLFYTAHADAWIGIEDVIPRKVAALRHHASQIAHPEELDKDVREWAVRSGEAGTVGPAEGFRRLVLRGDEDSD